MILPGAVAEADSFGGKTIWEGRAMRNQCSLWYPSQECACTLKYDANKLPYLGVWITAGG